MGRIICCICLLLSGLRLCAATPALVVTPASLAYTYNPSQSSLPAAQNISVSGGTSSLTFTATGAVATPSGGGWLSVSPNSGVAPLAVKVTVNPTGLPIGSYSGTVTITAAGASNSPRTVPVTLTVKAPAVSLTVSPAAMTFNYQVGAALPAAQTFSLSTSGSFLSYSVSTRAGSLPGTASGGNWLKATPVTGLVFAAFRATLTVSADPTDLYPGTYTGAVTIASPGAATPTQTFAITLVITPGAPTLTSLWPADITQGAAATTITLTGTALYSGTVAKARNGAVDTNLTANLLSPTLMTAVIPAALLANPTTLQIRVTNPAPAGDSNSLSLPVLAPGPKISVPGTVNAASLIAGPVSPGEILVLFGSGMGTATLTVAGAGDLLTTLGGTQVLFDATAAPLIYTHDRQVACIVPYSVAGPTVQITVVYNGVTSNAITVNVASAAPALFSIDGSGKGQVAAINADGTINADANPASRGSIVMLFCTGEGETNPAGVDGQINAGPTYPAPLLPASVTIGGVSAQVLYAGGAGGAVAGLCQINVKIPEAVSPGSNVPVQIMLGTTPTVFTSPVGTTLSVK